MKSNIQVNRRTLIHLNRGRPVRLDPEFFKRQNTVERLFSRIEAFKRISPRYERYEHSFLRQIHLVHRAP
ncbi:MAG: transposase [Methanomicrobiales archaeon]|nr:transposase [Methanomicrobiales archaeon]